MNPLGLVAVAVMALSIALIPLGLPGIWIIVVIIGVGVWLGEIALWVLGVAVALATLAELAEWLVVQRMSARHGGSPRAFWGAIAGGMVGVLVGAPVPLAGSIVGGFIGSFAGAALVTYQEIRDVDAARRVGWSVVVARTVAVGLKVAVALVMVVLGGVAWTVR